MKPVNNQVEQHQSLQNVDPVLLLTRQHTTKPKKKAVAKKRRISLADCLVVLISLTGAIFAFLFFWRDLNGTLQQVNEASIGSVHYKYKVAQRRFSDRLVWDMLKQDSPVYSGDMLHTANLGEATISFNNGASIEMGENTMAQIFDSPDGMKIEFTSGKIDVSAGTNTALLRLVASGTEVHIAAGSIVSANAHSEAGAAIQVVQGNAQIVTKDGERQSAVEGQALALSTEGKVEAVPVVTLSSPPPNKRFISDGGEVPVEFIWKTSNFTANHFVRFEVSDNPRFTNIIESAGVRDTDRQRVLLPAGAYWWRAYPTLSEAEANSEASVDGGGAAAALSNKLLIIRAAKPELLAPQNAAVFTYSNKNPQILFKWRNAEGEEGDWLLTVAGSPDFASPRITQNVRGLSFVSGELDAGRWYWRVASNYGAAEQDREGEAGDVSETGVFNIEKSTGEYKPVELSLPAPGAFVNIAPGSENITFLWKDESEAQVYRVSIARDADFSDIFYTRETRESRFVYNPADGALAAGLYFWRVDWKDADGNDAPPSATRYFTAIQESFIFESVSPAENWSVPVPSLIQSRFRWRSNAEEAGRLQVARDISFAEILAEIPAERGIAAKGIDRVEEAAGLNLPAGQYYWRARSGEAQTAPRRFEIRNAARVVLSFPANAAVLKGLEAVRNPPLLVWLSEERVVNTRLILSQNANPLEGGAVLDTSPAEKSVRSPPLEAGTYYWTVLAETPDGANVSAVSPFSFTVEPAPVLPAAALRAPSDNAAISAEQLRTSRSIDFTWNAAQGANAYILSIYRSQDSSRQNPVFTSGPIDATTYSFKTLNVLDAGSFVWQIEPVVINRDGRVEQRGTTNTRRFTINISLPQSRQLPDEETYGL
jgi:hypothetical protein